MGTTPLINASGGSEATAAGAAVFDTEPFADWADGAALDTARPEVFPVACADCACGDCWR